jgi:uncharacterized protein
MFWRSATLTVSVVLLASVASASEPRLQPDVGVTMTDGVRLSADLYLPAEQGKHPTILVRTPYGAGNMATVGRAMAEAGYATLVQDVRGQGRSKGQFLPFLNERRDGLETLSWIESQPWSNGKVGIWGSSYLAFCGIILTPESHPALKTVVNLSGWGDSDDLVYPGGALHLMLALPWMMTAQGSGRGSFNRTPWADAFSRLPVIDIPSSLGSENAAWRQMVSPSSHPMAADLINIGSRVGEVRIPILHLTGFNDFTGRGTIRFYEGVSRNGKAGPQHLVIGPWVHDQFWGTDTAAGDEDFGAESALGVARALEMSRTWFDRWLKDGPVAEGAPVRVFQMGANRWLDFQTWPPSSSGARRWRLSSVRGANGSSGDGLLAPHVAGAREVGGEVGVGKEFDEFVFNPLEPVPTVGGVNFHFFRDNLGVRDQRTVSGRFDILVYTTPPLEKPLNLVGAIRAVVSASSTGVSTDVTAKLVEVRSDGYERIIEDGIKRGPDDGRAMEPGKPSRFTIDLGGTAIRIPAGHRLRLEISSSNFPKYDRNPNTGEPAVLARELRAVTQRVWLRDSHLLLPVWEESR